MYGIVKDDFEVLKDVFFKVLQENDIVFILGGSFVGIYDNILKVIESLKDFKVFVDGVLIKSGKLIIIVKVGIRVVFGFFGYFVFCFFIFNFFVKRFIDIILYQQDILRKVFVKMKISIVILFGRIEFVFVKFYFGDEILVEFFYGKLGLINFLNNVSGYIRVDVIKIGIKVGDIVEVILI